MRLSVDYGESRVGVRLLFRQWASDRPSACPLPAFKDGLTVRLLAGDVSSLHAGSHEWLDSYGSIHLPTTAEQH